MQLYTKILIGMAVGALLGVLVGPNSQLLPQTGVLVSGTAQVRQAPGAPVGVAAARDPLNDGRGAIQERRG